MANKKIVDVHRLTSEEFAILAKASKDIFFFAQFIYLIHPVRGKVPFLLYPFQKSLLYEFLKNPFNVVLKFRQAGVTELIALFCLWMAMYHPHKNTVIISIKDRVAKKVLRKIKFMYKNLPVFIRTRIVNGRSEDSYGTATEMEFSNGSIISSIPTTEDAGRSEAVSLLVIDEAAIVRWAERIWAASWPTLSTGGRAIVNSTAYGVGNFFHKLYTDANAGGNVFKAIRLKWQMHPERYKFEGDMDWYNMQREILGPRKTAQEIDGDFLTSGNTVFDLADIKDIEEYIEDEVGKPIETHYKGLLKVYKHPKAGERYFLGADVATGRSNDFSTMSIQNKWGEEYVAYKGKLPVDKFRDMIGKWGRKYNRAKAAPESNDIGLAVAHGLQEMGYPNLYYHKKLLRKRHQARPEQEEIPGWYTTKANRPIIIDQLEEDVRNNTSLIKNKYFCQEAYTFIYDSRNRPIALNKDNKSKEDIFDETVYTDDMIFAEAITNWIRNDKNSPTTLPR